MQLKISLGKMVLTIERVVLKIIKVIILNQFITNQKELAEAAGCSEIHISKVKKRKVGLSEDLAAKLSEITGIKVYTWVAGSKASLKKQLRKFFQAQKLIKLYVSAGGDAAISRKSTLAETKDNDI